MTSADTCRGLTLLEVLIGVTVFSLGMLPVLFLTSTSGRDVYNVGRHLMASQLAGSLLDRCAALSFENCRRKVRSGKWPAKVLADTELRTLFAGSGTTPGKLPETLERTLKSFEYEVQLLEPSADDEKEQLYTLNISVTWLVEDADPRSRVRFILGMVKYREAP